MPDMVIPLNVTLSMEGQDLVLKVAPCEIRLPVSPEFWRSGGRKKLSLGPGKGLFDLVLARARELDALTPGGPFSAAELFHRAQDSQPGLLRSSFVARVVASAPDHPSYHHQPATRDYLEYLGDGKYRLKERARSLVVSPVIQRKRSSPLRPSKKMGPSVPPAANGTPDLSGDTNTMKGEVSGETNSIQRKVPGKTIRDR